MNDERSATAIDVRLGQRVRARRLEVDMSQERLADLIGVTFQQVQKYEKGVNRIAASRLLDIAKALDTSLPRLVEGFGGATKEPKNDRAADLMASPEGAELVRLFLALKTKSVRRRVVDLVRAIVEDE